MKWNWRSENIGTLRSPQKDGEKLKKKKRLCEMFKIR